MNHGGVPVLVFQGEYGAALIVRSVLHAEEIETAFDDVREGEVKVYVRRADEERARQLIARAAEP
jgi:hypothetical protein